MKSSIFWGITPCNPLKVNRRFGLTCRLHLQGRRIIHVRNQLQASKKPAELVTDFMLVSCLAYSSTLKTEVTCSSETSGDFQMTIRRYIPVEGSPDFRDIFSRFKLVRFHVERYEEEIGFNCLVTKTVSETNKRVD
jgi:hypothetical protein